MSIAAFYSYSHKDEHYKDVLETHLSILKRQGFIEGWSDRKIAPGGNWEEEIDLNLQKAKIVLLLVSANFLASDYCYDSETIYALEQHEKKNCIVIPIIVKPCLWQKSHFKHLQALPKDGKPISIWKSKDQAWLNVSEGILRVIESLNVKKTEPKENRKIEVDGKSYDIFISYSHSGNINYGEALEEMLQKKSNSLGELIEVFLRTFSGFYFSPLRIQKWGSKQHGFESFANYTTENIRNELESLLKSGKVKTTISKKGNRIYKIK